MKWLSIMMMGLAIPSHSFAQTVQMPGVQLTLGGDGGFSPVVKLILLLTVLSLAPAILIMMTSFTRIVVVLSFLRHALGTQQLPPNQLIVGLALFLTFFVMAPVFQDLHSNALGPYLSKQINETQAFDYSEKTLRSWMFSQTTEDDLKTFLKLGKIDKPETRADVPSWVLVPSFMISELKRAFKMGFMIYMPFLVLDMVVASVLMAMGMLMLPPVMISLPFKLLLFVLVDGWQLLIGSLVKSLGGV